MVLQLHQVKQRIWHAGTVLLTMCCSDEAARGGGGAQSLHIRRFCDSTALQITSSLQRTVKHNICTLTFASLNGVHEVKQNLVSRRRA
jgi:hypothetical protein